MFKKFLSPKGTQEVNVLRIDQGKCSETFLGLITLPGSSYGPKNGKKTVFFGGGGGSWDPISARNFLENPECSSP